MDSFATIVSILYQFATNGAFLLLSALGLIVILGMMNIINLAHGELMMMGAYTASIAWHRGVPFWLCAILAFLVVALFKESGRDHADQIHSPAPDAVRDVAGKRDGNEGDAGRRHHRGENEVPQHVQRADRNAWYRTSIFGLLERQLIRTSETSRYLGIRMRKHALEPKSLRTPSLRCRETEFLGQRQTARKGAGAQGKGGPTETDRCGISRRSVRGA